MGMFDRILFRCSQCGEEIEEQSKAGSCNLINYAGCSVPVEIAADIVNNVVRCKKCEKLYTIRSCAPTTVQCWLE